MKRLSWRRENVRADLYKLPMIWRAILCFIFVITTLFVMSLTEIFHVFHGSWAFFLIAVTYAATIFVAVRFLRLKITS